MLNKELLKELEVILREDYGQQNLTPEQVFEIGNNLAGYFDLLTKFNQENKDTHEQSKISI